MGSRSPCGGSGVAEAARGRELDLHQPDGAAAADQRRLVFALAHDHPMHQRFRNAVGPGMGRDQRFVLRALLRLRSGARKQRPDAMSQAAEILEFISEISGRL